MFGGSRQSPSKPRGPIHPKTLENLAATLETVSELGCMYVRNYVVHLSFGMSWSRFLLAIWHQNEILVTSTKFDIR